LSSTHDLLEKIPALVAYIDASGVYRRMSHAYERWCGIRREEWLGRHYSEVAPGLFGEAYTREVLPRLERAFAGEAVNFEGRPLMGEVRGQVAVSYTPDFDEYGKVAGVLVLVTDLAPLKEAENRAMLNEERLRLAADFSNMGMWEWDLTGDLLAWNAAAFRVMGWRGNETVPTAEELQERIHPDDRAERSATLEQARQTRKPFRLEYRIRNQEGGWNWVHSRGCFLPDEQEESARAVGVCFDITREKLATEQLVKQNQMIDSILESTTDGVVMVDFEFRFTYFNSRAKAVLGVDETLLGRNLWETFPQTRDTRFGEAYRRTIQERAPMHFEEYYPEPLNRWFEVHAYPVESGLAAFFRDITEEREGREQLRLREQAIAAVPVGISVAEFSAEKDYPLVYVNPTFERLTGYSLDEIRGKNCRFLQGPETSPELRTQIGAAVAAGEPAKFVVRNYRKDGTDFLNELQISPVRNEVGEITHLVGIQSDVTELWTARGRLIQQAHFDPLTELPNRFYFMDTLKQVLRGARRGQDSETALVYLDVDNLKHFNEQLGHSGGDRLLKKVASRIRSSVRDSDFVARLSGASLPSWYGIAATARPWTRWWSGCWPRCRRRCG
jgi:PAS domain S-box-containing protein